MKHWFVLLTTAAAITAFAPMTSQAQVDVRVPGVGVRIGEPERPPRDRERVIEREVRGGPECRTTSVTETAPDGSTRTVTRKKCD
jgi:hypothetical protein